LGEEAIVSKIDGMRHTEADMAELRPQNLSNHTRLDPRFHFFLIPMTAVMFVSMVWHAVRHPDFVSIWMAIGTFLFGVAVFLIRIYALKVQDRLIRLEEKLRLSAVMPESQRDKLDHVLNELTERQLIALRFASDAELPELAMRTAKERLAPKDIKKSIRTWRADYFRV
jgi:hypothetical protein